jgi:hypothetical protein
VSIHHKPTSTSPPPLLQHLELAKLKQQRRKGREMQYTKFAPRSRLNPALEIAVVEWLGVISTRCGCKLGIALVLRLRFLHFLGDLVVVGRLLGRWMVRKMVWVRLGERERERTGVLGV